jgi:very-short-patch-repair endonuclease
MVWTKAARKKHSGIMSKVMTDFWANKPKSYRIKRSVIITAGQIWDESHRKNQAKNGLITMRRRFRDPVYRSQNEEQLALALSSRWAKKENRAIQSKRMQEQLVQWRKSGVSPRRISKPQISLLKKLCCAGISGFKLEVPVGRYSLDVANPKRMLCIEIEGSYWHRVNKTDYKKRDAFLAGLGWIVKRFGTSRNEINRAFQYIKSHYAET